MSKEKRFSEELSFLSNMELCSIKVQGIEFPSVEHAYQILKLYLMEGDPERLSRLLAMSPYEIKGWAKEYYEKNRVDVDFLRMVGEVDLKIVMKILVQAKFAGNPGLNANSSDNSTPRETLRPSDNSRTTSENPSLRDKLLGLPSTMRQLLKTHTTTIGGLRSTSLVMEGLLRELRIQQATSDEDIMRLTLVEVNYWHDTHWGVCTCDRCRGVGHNYLGKILYEVWDSLRKE